MDSGCLNAWVAKILGLRNSWSSKLEMSVVEMYEQIFLLLEEKIKFSVEQKVFIVRVYYVTKSYKKVRKNFWGYIETGARRQTVQLNM